MRVAVLGAGNGGVASAFDFAQHGHEVALYATPDFDTNVVAVARSGGITARGDLEGFAPIRYSGLDAGEAMDGAELLVLVGPAYSTEPLAAVTTPYLTDGMAVLVCPGSCAGAIAFKRATGSARSAGASAFPTRGTITTIAGMLAARQSEASTPSVSS